MPTFAKPTGVEIPRTYEEAGSFQLDKGKYHETREVDVKVTDGKLTIRLELPAGETCAGIRELKFRKIE